MKKFALVLSGGGFNGAFQIGALKYLKENWSKIYPEQPLMKFDLITGVSIGALNGAFLASNQLDKLEKLWEDVAQNGVEEIYTSDFIDTKSNSDKIQLKIDSRLLLQRFVPGLQLEISFWKGLQLLLSPKKRAGFLEELIVGAEKDFIHNFQKFKSLADNTPLKKKIKASVNISSIKDCLFKLGLVSLDSGRYYSLQPKDLASDEDFHNALLASASMPIVWDPIPEINTALTADKIRNSIDGGLKTNSPLGDAIDEINKDTSGLDYEIFIINCNSSQIPNEIYDNANIAQIALRSLSDIALTEVFNGDLKEFLRINDVLEQVKAVNPELSIFDYDYLNKQRTNKILKSFKSIIIQPDTGVLGDNLVANKPLIYRRREHGREKAKLAMDQMEQFGNNYKIILT